jgi:hypothetical protein
VHSCLSVSISITKTFSWGAHPGNISGCLTM